MSVAYSSSILDILTVFQLSKIPTIGPDGFLLSYWRAFKFILNAQSMIQEGYDKVSYTKRYAYYAPLIKNDSRSTRGRRSKSPTSIDG